MVLAEFPFLCRWIDSGEQMANSNGARISEEAVLGDEKGRDPGQSWIFSSFYQKTRLNYQKIRKSRLRNSVCVCLFVFVVVFKV